MLKKLLQNKIIKGKKVFALFINPDKYNAELLTKLIKAANTNHCSDMVVIGTAIETKPEQITEFAKIVNSF